MAATILSPHFDDAVLSCWHVLDGPDDATVANVFTAVPPAGTPLPWWDELTGATDPQERMGERRAEDREALAVAGRSATSLDLLDDQYRKTGIGAADVAARIAGVVDSHAVLWAPAAISRHPDHLLVRDAAVILARAGAELVIYADLPHAIIHGWPDWVTGETGGQVDEVAAHWRHTLEEAGLEVDQLVRRVRPLDAAARARKLQALALYRTQRAALDPVAFVPLDDPRALGWEVSWSVPPSALGGTRELGGQVLVADPSGQTSRDSG